MRRCGSQNHCALCGIQLVGLKRRLFCPLEGQKFIREKRKPTPFLHAFLSNRKAEPSGPVKDYLCIPGVNWKWRVVQGSLRRATHPAVPAQDEVYAQGSQALAHLRQRIGSTARSLLELEIERERETTACSVYEVHASPLPLPPRSARMRAPTSRARFR